MRLGLITAVCLVVLAAGSLIYLKAQGGSSVSLTLGQNGLSSLKCNGREALADGVFRIHEVTLRKPSGETYAGSRDGTVAVDAARQESKITYPWGVVAVHYTATGNKLNVAFSVKNTSTSDAIQGLWVQPVVLRFADKLKEYDGSIPLMAHSVGGPALVRVSNQAESLLVTSDDASAKPVLIGFPWANNRPESTIFPLTVSTDRVKSLPDSYPVIERVIPAGGSDQFSISLRFGRPNATAASLAPDVYQRYAQGHLYRLNWPDHRPVGSVFLATAEVHSLTNPRGWLQDPSLDVTTEAGKQAFRARILALADTSVKILRDMNAQGAITWDIEGQEYAHAISYIGDPRALSKLAPEMDEIADEYFKRFRDAGFRVGLCIRPQQLALTPEARQISASDPAKVLVDKIRFAKNRWGASLIYLDSNVNANDPNPISAETIGKVADTFPDVLLIPEHSTFEYYAFSVPYRELRQGYVSTPDEVRAAYPKAFTFISTADGPIDYYKSNLSSAVKQGDSVIYRSWYPDPQNEKVKLLYH